MQAESAQTLDGVGPVAEPPRASRARALRSFVGQSVRDAVGSTPRRATDEAHLDAAVAWLKRAVSATRDDGVSYGYSVKGGWRESYRETSGYIATTFFDLASALRDDEAGALARSVSAWLCTIQEPDGGIANPRYRRGQGIVFDTGQVLLGLTRAFEETDDQRFHVAATRATQWLVDRVDNDGAWRRNTHNDTPHTYNSRVAWALLQWNAVSPDDRVEEAARRNLDWACAQERDGYFRHCAFEPGLAPFTHTIAYAIRGILEASRLLDDEGYGRVATRAADALLEHVRGDGWIPGQIDEQGAAAARYCCLTGNCQLAIIWLDLYRHSGEPRYLEGARLALDFVMRTQDVETDDLGIRGAIKGSHPIWGRYAPLSYPNWATKFYVDAMLRLRTLDR